VAAALRQPDGASLLAIKHREPALMADENQVALLRQGANKWNAWRRDADRAVRIGGVGAGGRRNNSRIAASRLCLRGPSAPQIANFQGRRQIWNFPVVDFCI
jgi:hypothetical protein